MQESKINIFYADDDHDDIEFFKDALSEATDGVTLESRSDGEELLQLLNNPPPKPSLVFLDWNMPGKNGAYVLRSMMANENTKHIPVVIISTSNHSVNIEQARELGAKMYMTKPTQFKDLVRMIKHCLKIDWSTFRANEENFFFSLS
jgi:CheY-like chemotaxis protein